MTTKPPDQPQAGPKKEKRRLTYREYESRADRLQSALAAFLRSGQFKSITAVATDDGKCISTRVTYDPPYWVIEGNVVRPNKEMCAEPEPKAKR